MSSGLHLYSSNATLKWGPNTLTAIVQHLRIVTGVPLVCCDGNLFFGPNFGKECGVVPVFGCQDALARANLEQESRYLSNYLD